MGDLSHRGLPGIREDFQGQLAIFDFPLHHLLGCGIAGIRPRPPGDVELVAIHRKISVLRDHATEPVNHLLLGQIRYRRGDQRRPGTYAAQSDGVKPLGGKNSAHPCIVGFRFALGSRGVHLFPRADKRILALRARRETQQENHGARKR